MALATLHPQKRKFDSMSKSKKKTCTRSKKPRQEGKSSGLFSRLIESGVIPDHSPVCYRRKRDGFPLKEGKFTRAGVLCDCCGQLFLLSKFEVHAGSSLHRPSANMFLRDGRSLMECMQAMEGGEIEVVLVLEEEDEDDDGNETICQICGDAGELILCDACPSAFHKGCLGMTDIPEGDWQCSACRCIRCGDGQRRTSSDMLSCAHCGSVCHCLCERDIQETESSVIWFCDSLCRSMWENLQSLLCRPQHLDYDSSGSSLSLVLLRSSENDNVDEQLSSRENDCVLSKRVSTQSLLAEALKVFKESFDPVVDPLTNLDFLSQAVYSKKAESRRLDCRGFYTVILRKDEAVVSVATVRVHRGIHGVAEMPFVATGVQYRQHGMCKALVGALQKMLQRVGVQRLVLPSIPELVRAWTGPFGFLPMSSTERKQISDLVIMTFPGTIFLQKKLWEEHEPAPPANKTQGIIRIKIKFQQPSDNAPAQGSQPVICH